MPRLLVTGVGGPAGRSVAEQLLDLGHVVIGVDMAAAPMPCVAVHEVPAAGSAHFLPALAEVVRDNRVDLIIPTVTEELLVLATGGRPEIGGVAMVVAPERAVRIANDKWLTYQALHAADVAVPVSMLPSAGLGDGEIRRRLGPVYISKPRVSRGGRNVSVHRPSRAPASRAFDDSTILQEFAPGQEYAVNLYLGPCSQPGIAVVLAKSELAHGEIGNGLRVERVDESEVAQLALRAAQTLGLTGPVDVDVRRRQDGEPVVLELNARFGAHSAHAPELLRALLLEHLPRMADVI